MDRALRLFVESLKLTTLIEHPWFCSFCRCCNGRGLGSPKMLILPRKRP